MRIDCVKMTEQRRADAVALLNAFLREDKYYLKTSAAYGDKGPPALRRATRMFLARPELGFVWIAYADDEPAGVCVVSYVISTSIGGLAAKLDDVFVAPRWQRQGVATAMLTALAAELKRNRVRRIDTSVYLKNRAAKAYYRRLGFEALNEERLAKVL